MQEKTVVKCLWGLRIASLAILIFTIYWSFSEVWFDGQFTYSIPLNFRNPEFNYQSPKMAVLFMPILVNIALWRLSYVSYLLIRVVIILELCKISIVVVMSAVTSIASLLGLIEHGKIITIFSTYVYFGILFYLNRVIRKPGWRNLFYNSHQIIKREKIKAIAIIAAFYCSLFFLIFIERSYYANQFSATENLTQYYVAGQDRGQSHVGYINELRMSPDGKWFSNVYSEEANRGDLGIFDIMTGKQIKKLNVKDVYYSAFYNNSDSLFLIKKNRENMVVFEEWSMVSGEKIRDFLGTDSLLSKESGMDFYVREISSSSKGTYVLTAGRNMALWNYQKGFLIEWYDDYAEEKQFDWLTDNTYIVMQIGKKSWKMADYDDEKKSVYVGEVSNNEKVIRKEKEIMTEDFQKKSEGLYRVNFSIKKGTEENIAATIINGISESGILRQKTYLDIWDIVNEKKLFSLENPHEIMNVLFYPDKKHVLLLENLYGGKRKISIWDINEHKKEKTYYFLDAGDVVDMEFSESGKQLVQLKNPVSIFDMK